MQVESFPCFPLVNTQPQVLYDSYRRESFRKKKINKKRVSKDMDSKQMEMHMKMMLRGVQNQP
jgi:hypothetical protein